MQEGSPGSFQPPPRVSPKLCGARQPARGLVLCSVGQRRCVVPAEATPMCAGGSGDRLVAKMGYFVGWSTKLVSRAIVCRTVT
jgi:hypothetical protein